MKKRILALCFAVAMLCGVHGSAMATAYSGENVKPISTYRDDDLDIDPVDTSSIPTTWSVRNTIPTSYKSPYVTSVKNQNPYGTCWAFAFISASEASLVQEGLASLGTDEVDLSELHLAYFMSHSVTDPLGGTAGDGFSLTANYTNAFLDEGGNQRYATHRVASWYGLVDEDIAPYDSVVDGVPLKLSDDIAYSKDLYHLENAYWVSMQDRETVKKLIMQYGACAASYYDDDAYYSVSNAWYLDKEVAVYCPTDRGTNHGITIIGWDDNYSIDNFGTYKPSSKGAWLCKNSWGSEYSKDGYFWISYEDVPLCSGEAFFYDFGTADNYDKNYQYDGGAIGVSYGCNYAANIFTADEDEYIKAVGFYTPDSNYDCTVKVYKNCAANNPTSGTLLTTVDANQLYAGYHTVELADSYLLKAGERFSVVVYQSATDGETTWVSVDSSYADGTAWCNNTSVAKEGQSFVSSSAVYWQDVSVDNRNCRIKAYTDVRIPVTAVEVDKETLTLYTGETDTLSATVTPDDASEKDVTWSSSDDTVATVDKNGVVTAKKAGTATITCKSNEVDAVESQCTVTVKQWVEGVTLSISSAKMIEDEELLLNATILPTDATDKSLKWTSSDTDVVTVSDTGVMTAVGYGTATVTCTATDRSTYSASCEISVCEKIDSITLEEVKEIYVGNSAQLEYSVTPVLEQTKGVTWSTSKEDVVIVDSDGKITAMKTGTAVITCKSNDVDGVEAQCIVTVKQWVESVTLNVSSAKMVEGETLLVVATISPTNATDRSVKWTSSDTNVVTVSDTGELTAVGYGTATVTCTATDRSTYSASCVISVCDKIDSITLEEVKEIYVGNSAQLEYSVTPDVEQTKGVTWTTSNENVATVDSTGKITAKKAGTAVVTCKSNDIDAVEAQCIVTVKQWVKGVTLNVSSSELLEGETLSLKATISPTDATDKSLKWTSSDIDVVTVSDTGVVTAVGYGTATVTCTATDRSTYSASCVISVCDKIDSITLEEVKEIYVGNSAQLEYSATPDVEQTKGVTWTTSNENVATVDSTGKITAKKAGTAVVTCKSNNIDAVEAQCIVTVKQWVKGVTLNVSSSELLEGETLSLKATISPTDATDKSLKWTSSNTDVVTVSNTGKVTAVGYGTATVTCTATDRSTYSANCVISVCAKVKNVTLEKSKQINVGDSVQLEYSVTPDVEQTKGVMWTTSNENVVTVDSTGKITAKQVGTAVVTCQANDSGAVKAQCVVTVVDPIVVREKGDVIKDSATNAEYKVTASGTTGATVQFAKGSNTSGKVTIPDTITIDGVTYKVTTIAANAFKGNTKVTKIVIKDNVTSIGKNAFYGCAKLTSVTIGKNVTTIGDNAFYNCKKLKTVTLGQNVKNIGNKAFYQCSKLSKIVIPSKVTKIGKQAFYKCKSLKSITIKTTKLTKKKVGSNAFKGIHSKATIKVPKKQLQSYKSILKARGIGSKVKVKKY